LPICYQIGKGHMKGLVETQALELSETDEEAVLEGKTSDGTPIRVMDTVRVVS